ncbi:MAG: hypothetical protein IH998_04915, partial [Proteobacteria bacterium]|nr:hypothetical protein [Pseudomonadota bacterium]
MGKKHKQEEHVNMEAWVISYADMVTLLFALFVVLYALGEIKLSKLKDRFPPRLRVHLAVTNIRDVVHKRLLAKKPDQEQTLRALF